MITNVGIRAVMDGREAVMERIEVISRHYEDVSYSVGDKKFPLTPQGR